ncbi:MAG: methylenetetrahydrofolate reductase [NAD(P)H] [Burkholderiaceae bacterium]
MDISFEFFPPKTPEGELKLATACARLQTVGPRFYSVTYGAGGTTQSGTIDTVRDLLAQGFDAAPHLSCVGSEPAAIGDLLDAFKIMGVRRIVALRGDLPSGMIGGGGSLRYASDLVAFIRRHSGDHFHIEVAAYPEMHPQAVSPQADLQAFVTKVKAGANSAITQYFYNPDAYARFVDEVVRQGVYIPIVPGIMPITNFTQLARFSDACGAEIPRWVRLKLQSFGDDRAAIQAFGHEVAVRLCEALQRAGAPGLHFYTMNSAEPALAIMRDLKLANA